MCYKSCSVYSITNPKVNLYSPILSKFLGRNSGMRWHSFCTKIELCFTTFSLLSINNREEGTEFVDLLDTLWYVFTGETDADFETFCRIFKSKGVIIETAFCLNYIYIIFISPFKTGFNQTLCTHRQEQGGSSVGRPSDGFLHRKHFTKVSRFLVSLSLTDRFLFTLEI